MSVPLTPLTYEITVRKTLPGPPEAVWETWTDPDLYAAVHGSHAVEIDFRPGGTIRVQFFPDCPGSETFVLREIDAPRRLVFAWRGEEAHPVTLSIAPCEGGCEVAISQECGEDLDWIGNCLDGWAWILDSLERYLETGEGIANEDWSREHGTRSVVRREV